MKVFIRKDTNATLERLAERLGMGKSGTVALAVTLLAKGVNREVSTGSPQVSQIDSVGEKQWLATHNMMRIGTVAYILGRSDHTIRKYQRMGVLHPSYENKKGFWFSPQDLESGVHALRERGIIGMEEYIRLLFRVTQSQVVQLATRNLARTDGRKRGGK